jgi:hypothetical protein
VWRKRDTAFEQSSIDRFVFPSISAYDILNQTSCQLSTQQFWQRPATVYARGAGGIVFEGQRRRGPGEGIAIVVARG